MKQNGFSNVAVILFVAVLGVVGFAAWRVLQNSDDSSSSQTTITQTEASIESEKVEDNVSDVVSQQTDFLAYKYQAILADETGGAELLGVYFNGKSSGIAYADTIEGTYDLYATFKELPELPDNLFYEGWVVGGENGIISTGELILRDGVFVNEFTSAVDLTDSTRYVLTLEPRDDNPAPAPDHIVEGDFSVVESN